jgi:hypothetical protein
LCLRWCSSVVQVGFKCFQVVFNCFQVFSSGAQLFSIVFNCFQLFPKWFSCVSSVFQVVFKCFKCFQVFQVFSKWCASDPVQVNQTGQLVIPIPAANFNRNSFKNVSATVDSDSRIDHLSSIFEPFLKSTMF